MPEYLKKRFGGQRIRVYFAVLSLILYIFTKCSVNLYTGGIFIQQSLGWDLYLSILLQIAVVGLLTITGGLTAVIYTDTLQAILMIGGSITLTIMGFIKIGGFQGLWAKYPYAMTNYTVTNTTCHYTNKNWYVMLRGPNDPEMPWPGFLLGQTPGSIWYWCSDQVIVQRVLAAKGISHAQGATIMAGFIKILPLFMMVLPDEVGCVDPERCWQICQSYAGCYNIAYPKFVLGVMGKVGPVWSQSTDLTHRKNKLKACACTTSTNYQAQLKVTATDDMSVAQLVKELDKHMSGPALDDFVSSQLQHSSPQTPCQSLPVTISENTPWKCNETQYLSRVFIVVMIAVAIAWVPVVKETQGGQVFIYIQEVTNYLAPPVASVYLIAILWPRCNEKGCFWGLMAGFVTGVTRLILIFVYPGPSRCGEVNTRPPILVNMHYMYFAMLLFWITFIVTLYRTLFWTRYHKHDLQAVTSGKIKVKWHGIFNFSVITISDTQTYDNPVMVTNDLDVEIANPGKRSSSTQWDAKGIGMKNIEKQVIPSGGATFADIPGEASNEGKSGSYELQLADQVSREKQSCKDFMYNWICGISRHGNQNEIANLEARKREAIVSDLEQSRGEKICLYCMLVLILCCGVFLYCFWSLWKYNPEGDVWSRLERGEWNITDHRYEL
ncbi:hypothetical protein LSH36_293g02003 [Paralvinella palmiformis]|uniref:Uncharacterized protein n=1 Tax=Paralvinella palmiformis TaxID=53620 RepID=A0AAD9N1C6_9ANNE|nr:hypothetical protein LSH36_293g02003 [Paralvinella palmiformis]